MRLIEFSALSVAAQQHKSAHILVISWGRAILDPKSPADMCGNERKNHLTPLSL